MRKKTSIILFLFFVIILPKKISAFEPFVPSLSNPLTVSSHYQEWNETGVLQGQILRGSDSSYTMWYSSLGNGLRVAKATSTDGLSWEGNAFYSFLGNQDTHDPYYIQTGTNYLYFATTPPGGVTRIMRITQANGNFDNSTIREVFIQGKNWGVNGTTSPILLFENNIYYLFYSALGATWDTGMATSQDGVTFDECRGNPFLIGDTVPRSLIKFENEYYLFFHSPQGIGYVKAPTLDCNATWSARTLIGISAYFPSAIQIPGEFRIYYGSPLSGAWKLYLATSSLLLPTPSPSPTPTPTTVSKNPIILIPGLFGSWNKESILHGVPVNQSEWVMNPVVHEYEGLEKTLQNRGYEKNKDYYLFFYDWRKNIERSADDLNTYINKLHLSSRPDIVGHSLGGLIARIFEQKYGSENVRNVITVGSPHGGTAHVYKAVEGGEIETDNSFFWLAQQLVLQLNRDGLKTNKQIIAEKFPVIQNLLPVDDYLTQGNSKIPVSGMKMKNNVLPYSSTSPTNIKAIVGEKGNTLSGYRVTNRTVFDELLDYYPDGRPTMSLYSPGDFTVITSNAKMGAEFSILPKDHRELVYSKEGIKKILDILGLSYQEKDIIEGRGTQVTPALIFLMLSPAQIEITHGVESFQEQEGIVFIENASSGTYQIETTGKAKGRYTILIGQIGQQDSVWDKIEGEITQEPPTSQIDTYQILFNNQLPSNPVISPQAIIDELNIYLFEQNKTMNRIEITNSLANLAMAKQYLDNQNLGRVKTSLLTIHQQLFTALSKISVGEKHKILYAVHKLENLYERSLGTYAFGIFPTRLRINLNNYKRNTDPIEKHLLFMKAKNKNIDMNVNYLIEIKNRLAQAEKSFGDRKYNYTEILIKSVAELLKEVREF